MLRLILGRAGTGKTGLILDELNELVRSRRSGGWLIVPEQYSHEAERELAERCGDTACLYAEVVSFTRLAYRVSVSVGGSARTFIDRGGRLLQLALALDRIGGTLEVYGSAARRPELMSPLLTALDELRYGRADSGALRAAASELDGPLAAKLRDLALIRETLDALEASSGADPASRLDILAEQIPACDMLRGGCVYIDGFTDFTDDALHLDVPGMPDDDYSKPLRGEFASRLVDSLYKGTGRVDDANPPCIRRLPHLRGDAMRRKEHRRAVRNLGETLDE